MPNPTNPEAAAIEAAYGEQVKALYKVLVANLVEGPDAQDSDQSNVERFEAGLRLAKRAKALALSAAASPTPAAPVKTASARKKK